MEHHVLHVRAQYRLERLQSYRVVGAQVHSSSLELWRYKFDL
jgi:hypothetical protein